MTHVGAVASDASTFVDGPETGQPRPGIDYVYRVTAVDAVGNESATSNALAGRCYHAAPPVSPELQAERTLPARVTLTWAGGDATLRIIVLARAAASRIWSPLSAWADAAAFGGTHVFDGAQPGVAYRFKLRVMDAFRHAADSNEVEA